MNKDLANKAKTALLAEMQKQGIQPGYLAFIMPQLAVETAGFNSKVSNVNNLSGHIWAGQKVAYDSGIKKPKGEKPGTYAGYISLDLWAKDYLYTLQKMGALKAKSIDEFAAILKSKGYYEADQSIYQKALNSWLPQLKKMFTDIDFTAPKILVPVMLILLLTIIIIK